MYCLLFMLLLSFGGIRTYTVTKFYYRAHHINMYKLYGPHR